MKDINYIHFIFCTTFVILLTCNLNSASDVLGCGGFIKSHAPIDFAKIEVKLFTKQGNLKDSTNCAPNNGYYFLPLYDKGDYYLKINPPAGWSIKPNHVNLKIDGTTDLCSQGKDINFVFEGFGITGQVDNLGGGSGPAGVKIKLIDGTKVSETTTSEGGTFYFTPVYPGTYTVLASHPKWKLSKDKIVVPVDTGNTELPKNSLLVNGYDVTGSVALDRNPISNVNFVLFSETNHPVYFEGCNTKELLGFVYKKPKLCHVTSNAEGTFTFAALSPGKYRLLPFYEDKNIKYHIYPKELEFKVSKDSVVLEPAFMINSFSITGHVLTNPEGKKVHGATIFINDKPTTVTQVDGSFLLDNINAGTYNILIEAPGMKFNAETLKISSKIQIKSEFYPSAFQVCGNVANKNSQTVILTSLDSKVEHKLNTAQETGNFCHFLSPGKYSAEVIVSTQDRAKGIQFFPVTHNVQVTTTQVMGINFSQLKATVSGQVKCLTTVDCSQLSIIMKHIDADNKAIGGNKYTTILDENSSYTIVDVIPGSYHVTLENNKFCWETDKHIVTLNSKTTVAPNFVQKGYKVIFQSSHNAQVKYQKLLSKPDDIEVLEIIPGQNMHCLEKAGLYEFSLQSCHLFENPTMTFNTNDENTEIVLTPIKHLVTVDIKTIEVIDNLNVSVVIGNKISIMGPLEYQHSDDLYYYRVKVYLGIKEQAVLTPLAEYLWFKPKSFTIMGGKDCVDNGPQITGLKGKVIRGKILPALAGVKIIAENNVGDVLTRDTDHGGNFKFPILDASFTYKVTASKDSYFFTGPNANGDFIAHKLAEVIVEVVDESNGSPLQGALLSLSGAESYRSNLQTNNEGIIRFTSLNPSDYFLRPMMKEYNFEPSSKIISVEEGATVNIKLSGQRVAYSVYGSISTLSGEPEEKMIILASGIGDCAQYGEETTSEDNGLFRIRGLHPHCSYDIKVKESSESVQKIENAIPESVNVYIEKEDVFGIKLIVICQVPTMDIVAHVTSPNPEYFKSLRVKLCRENAPNSPIYNFKLDPTLYKVENIHNPGVLVHLPSLPIDNKLYFIRLDSSLSQNVHSYSNDVQYFMANSSFKYFELKFNPNSHSQDHNIAQTSVLTLPFILLCVVAFYNIEKLSKLFMEATSKIDFQNLLNMFQKVNVIPVDKTTDEDIDQIVQSINAPKRKTKVRKI